MIKQFFYSLLIFLFTLYHSILQPSVRTCRSNGSVDDTTFSGALKCFSDITGTKSAVKRIGTEVIQLLLVHGFQVIGLALALYELIYILVNK